MRKLLTAILALAAFLAVASTPEARRAFRTFEQRAIEGDSVAQYRLGTILETGWDSIPADSVRALGLFRSSALAGFPPAVNYMGYLYGKGYSVAGRQLVAVNPDSARYWLQRSADMGDPRAMSNLAYLILEQAPDRHNDSIAYAYLIKGARDGAPTALTMLGDMTRDGRFVTRDTLKAALYYEAALEHGFADAEPRLISLMAPRWESMSSRETFDTGMRYFTGYAPSAGTWLLKRVARLPAVPEHPADSTASAPAATECKANVTSDLALSARANTLLGEAASRGTGLPYSHAQSMEYYVKGALAGDPSALFILSETIGMFPDAIDEVKDNLDNYIRRLQRVATYTGVRLPHLPDLRDPELLRLLAAKAGITNAEQATERLY